MRAVLVSSKAKAKPNRKASVGNRSAADSTEVSGGQNGAEPMVNSEQQVEAKVKPSPVAAAKPSSFDWRNVPNAELNGDRRRDAYAEKLRRSVEAIQEYNAGRELNEQYAINSSSLRQMTKVKPDKVKEWMDKRNVELGSYSDSQGHSYQQNKGKADIREVIKWNEAAYGAYEW